MIKCHFDDIDALLILQGSYSWKRGIIRPNIPGQVETPEETMAIDYLCSEWDYGYEEM